MTKRPHVRKSDQAGSGDRGRLYDARVRPNRDRGRVGGVPSDALGLCKDGAYVSTGSKQTACSAHGGMKIWYPDGTPN
ncbi:hypothetical protein DMC47_25615 [Nostoc sp. 3335mG]|nr:hypothetical protein DMC47_25615 [Nostoc sp. 3335mG]